ncbi:MAG: smalltalk protein [Prevotella sp.]|jgi:hypothetical protein|nr:smalltalk protein [Prevotella sp.]
MKNTNKTTLSFIIKVIIALGSALLGVIGGAEAYSAILG